MLRRQMHVPAPAGRLWRALTEPDEVGMWFGAAVEWDLSEGGRASWEEADGRSREGRVEFVERERTLRFRWWETDHPEDASEVTYRLDPDDEGTTLTVTERVVASPEPASARVSTFGAEAASLRWGTADEAAFACWAADSLVVRV